MIDYSVELPAGNVVRQAVILAGGRGTRLGPYTTILPKPLMPIGDRAILEIMIAQLHSHGFRDLIFTVGYLGHLLKAVFNDGAGHGVTIRYQWEDIPLGTAGPLGTIDELDETFLFMNGDILTTLDYGDLYDAHRRAGLILTVASYRRSVPIEFGVLHLSDDGDSVRKVVRYEEKPNLNYFVSMGVYAAEPEIRQYISPGEPLDLPDLVQRIIAAGEPVGAYVHDGYWLDIGRHEDYEQAITDPLARSLIEDLGARLHTTTNTPAM